MRLKKFKERDNKKIGVVVFTLVCLFLVSGAILYRTFAIFEVRTNQNVINGNVQTGDILFAFYYENDEGKYVITDQIPDGDYVLSTSQSYCGFAGQNDGNIKVSMNSDKTLVIEGLSRTSTKCKLYFEKKSYNPFPQEVLDKVDKTDETTGNGLYTVDHKEDGTELGNEWKEKPELRYAGPSPDNYVWFNCKDGFTSGEGNCEKWRIIGLVNVKTTSSTIEQRIKIIKVDPIKANDKNFSWDYGEGKNENDWTQATLMEMLNDIYYESHSGNCYQGSNEATTCDFTRTGLKESARDMIDKDIIWNIGGWEDSKVTTSAMYGYERGETVYNERPTTWSSSNTKRPATESGKLSSEDPSLFHSVGLMYPSDYGYAVGGTNRETCLTTKTLWDYKKECYKKDWLLTEEIGEQFLSPVSSRSNRVFCFFSSGYVDDGDVYSTSYAVRPVVYLSSSVSISDGDGSSTVPFELSVES